MKKTHKMTKIGAIKRIENYVQKFSQEEIILFPKKSLLDETTRKNVPLGEIISSSTGTVFWDTPMPNFYFIHCWI